MILQHCIRAVRMLARDWVRAVIGVLAIGVSIGAVNATVAIFRAFLLETHPYVKPDGIVTVGPVSKWQNGAIAGTSVPNYLDVTRLGSAYSETGFTVQSWTNLGTDDMPVRERLLSLTPSMFRITGVRTQLGRTFSEEEGASEGARVVVLGADLWRSEFAGAPDIVGRTIRLNEVPHTVIGVLETDKYVVMRSYQIYVPFAVTAENRAETNRNAVQGSMFARLAPGVGLERARAETATIRSHILGEHPELKQVWDLAGEPVVLHVETVNANVFKFGWSIMPIAALSFLVVSLFVLVVCGLNLTTMMLSRLSARQREFSIRVALGASRAHIARQLAVESAVLYAFGGLFGILASVGIVNGLRAMGVEAFDIGGRIRIDWMIAGAGVLLGVVLGAAFGVLPIYVMRLESVAEALRSGGGNSSLSRGKIRVLSGMVVTQIAVAFVLMVLTALMVATSKNVLNADPGFTIDQMAVASLDLPEKGYENQDSAVRFVDHTLDGIRRLPQVEFAGIISQMPFLTGVMQEDVSTTHAVDLAVKNRLYVVSEGALESLQVALLKGRRFRREDDRTGERVVVIDHRAEELLFNGGSGLGQLVVFRQQTYRVVGVVRAMKHFSLTEAPVFGAVYFSARQWYVPRTHYVIARVAAGATVPARSMVDAIRKVDPQLPRFEVQTMRELWNRGFSSRDAMSTALTGAAGVAIVLACLGSAGMFAFFAKLFAKAIGIRMALGAQPGQAAWAVFGRAPIMLGVGIGAGIVLSLTFAKLASAMFYNVSLFNPLAIGLAALVTVTVSALACVPALLKCLRVDPLDVLRES